VSGNTEERPWRLSEEFDAEELVYTLQTVHGDHYTIDARSGSILASVRPFRTTMVVIVLPLILIIVVILLVCMYRSIRRAGKAL